MNRHERGVWLCVAGLFLTVAIMGNPPGSQTYGDTDGNGVVDNNDVQAILRVIRGETASVPNASHFEFCDIDQDGGLTLADAEALQQHLQGESLEVMATSADGHSTNLETGSVVYVRVSDRFFPYLIAGGTIHIRSRAAGYDSGELPLTHEQFGGSYFYRWYTAKCKPASDYELTVAVSKRDKAQKEKRLAVRLSPPAAEESLLLAHSGSRLGRRCRACPGKQKTGRSRLRGCGRAGPALCQGQPRGASATVGVWSAGANCCSCGAAFHRLIDITAATRASANTAGSSSNLLGRT